MREGVLPLNIVISVLYIAIAALVALVLKKSSRSLKRGTGVAEGEEGWRQMVNINRTVAVSWMKKYSVVGGCFNEDKKYLLKEFMFVAAYAVTCL
jgi:hypothetical protein